MSDLEQFDDDLKQLLDEIYLATNDQQLRLLSMGVRAALDHLMTKMLGGDLGSFEVKLAKMEQRGHLTRQQKQNLETVIDAGSASSHRAFKPPQQLLDEMLVVMETMVREHYFTGPMLATLKAHIPPRPPRA